MQSLESGNFLVIAHRGWSGAYPENTLIAMREAIRIGCHMIEIDVTLSADRHPIIIHDSTLNRTSNGDGPVNALDYRTLRRLDAGSWFHPTYSRLRLPSLGAVFRLCRESEIMINVEIKPECFDAQLREDGIEHSVIREIRRNGVQDRVLISCFRWPIIERIRQIAPEIKTALLHHGDLGRLKPDQLKQRYGIVSFHPHGPDLTQTFVDKCHAAGLLVFPYTINSYRDMGKYLNMGVDGMFTNHPNRLLRFAHTHSSHLEELRVQEDNEDFQDREQAIQRREDETRAKALRQDRWRANRLIRQSPDRPGPI